MNAQMTPQFLVFITAMIFVLYFYLSDKHDNW